MLAFSRLLHKDRSVLERVKALGPAGVGIVVGAFQIRVIHEGAGQVRPYQVGTPQVGSSQLRGRCIDVAEVRALEVGSLQMTAS